MVINKLCSPSGQKRALLSWVLWIVVFLGVSYLLGSTLQELCDKISSCDRIWEGRLQPEGNFKGKPHISSPSPAFPGKADLKYCFKLDCEFGLGNSSIDWKIHGSFLNWLKCKRTQTVTMDKNAGQNANMWVILTVPSPHIWQSNCPEGAYFHWISGVVWKLLAQGGTSVYRWALAGSSLASRGRWRKHFNIWGF